MVTATTGLRRPVLPLLPPNENSLHILRLCAEGHLSDALAALYSLKPQAPHPTAYAALFHSCARHGLLAHGESLHRHMLLSSHHPNLVVSNHLVNMYAKCGRVDIARRLFDEMPRRNLVSWTALLTGYAHCGRHEDTFRLFSSMLPHHLPNEFGLAAVLSSCARSRHSIHGRQVHALASKTSIDTSVFVGNALITMYSSCHGHGDDGWSVFQTMPHRNLITWNSMIAGFQMNGRPGRSLDLFAQMHRASTGFDRATLVSTISSCSSVQQCRQLHSLMIKTCFASEAEVATSLLKAYSGLSFDTDDCYRVFSGIREHDTVSWTGIITSCAERDPKEAIFLFCRMRREGFLPDRFTLSIVVKACAGFATERHCSALHSLIMRSGFVDDTVLSNALIHAYARCGIITLAEQVFELMEFRDVVSWNSMIKAYAAHGRGREALEAFARMDVLPDACTFVGILMACSHGGLVNEGREIFKSMHEVYGIAPQLDHFACMVDILGRAGNLLPAEDLINQMPMEPDSAVWSALLGACRKHREAKIGERAAQKLMELEPQNSVGYVMMSNIYCAMGSYGDAALTRKGMKEFRVKKEPGLSWIEIGIHVHEFSAGGQRHEQIEAIYVEVKRLADKLKEMGYVAATRLVLHEIDEEHKEERLLHHSEKLALAFGLMNASTAQACVKIMKNIRICEDCHNFIKFASKCVGKEIVVRDPNRFHHFIDGVCSCADYW